MSGWPEDLIALGPELKAAQDRGVDVYVLCFGEAELPVGRAFYHSVTGLQYLQVSVIGRWLLLVEDVQDCLIVQVSGPEHTTGLLSKSPLVSFIVAQWIYHDITTLVYAKEFSRGTGSNLSPEKQALLQAILEWKPGDPGGFVELPEDAPGVWQIFEQIRKRLNSNPALAGEIGGLFEFRISGEDGGVFHIDLRAGQIIVEEAMPMLPDLSGLSAHDFRAMAWSVCLCCPVYQANQVRATLHLRDGSGGYFWQAGDDSCAGLRVRGLTKVYRTT